MRKTEDINNEYVSTCTIIGDLEANISLLSDRKSRLIKKIADLKVEMDAVIAEQGQQKDEGQKTDGGQDEVKSS